MTKQELITKVAEKAEMSKKDSTKVVDAVLDAIVDGLKEDGRVQLIGFGNFVVRERAARKGRNPQTGEEIMISESKTVGFKAGKQLKESVN